jgi:[ribosomal protein S18]-alanine N-acetyltransferase
MNIVAMAAKHIPLLMHHEQAMFGAESWSDAAYREELADRRNRFYVVALDDADGLLGWAGLRVLADEAEVLTIGVVPEARRRGVGAALLDELLDEARRRAARVVFLDVRVDNDDAQRIYVRAGFAAVGVRRGYYDNGRTDSLTMSLALKVGS